jgi:hypothetical protein
VLDQATQADNEALRDLPPRRQDIPGGAMVPTTIALFSVSGLRNSQRRILDVACSGDGHLMGGKMKKPARRT